MQFVDFRSIVHYLFITLLVCPITAFGVEFDELSELDYLADLPITFSATRLPQTLSKAPASITIIDRQIINASSATTIAELFRLVPGMQSYHIATNAPAVAYHGMSDKFPSRMEIMIDGRSVYLPLFSAVIWESLPISIDDIERIEVVRGSNTVTQGSNAFLGAVNIITHTAHSAQENIVKYQQGEFNNQTVYGRYNATHKLGYFNLSVGITGNEGNRFANGNSDPYFNRHLTFNTSISPTLLDTLTLNLGVNAGYSSVGDIRSDPNPQRREFETSFQSIEWKHLLNSQDELQLRYSHSKSDYDAAPLSIANARALFIDREADTLDGGTQTIDRDLLAEAFLEVNPYKVTAEIGQIEQHQLELSYRWTPTAYDQLLTGVEYRYEAAQNYQILNTHNWIAEESSRVFIHWENTRQQDWTFNLGASLEHGGQNSIRLSPRLAANYQLNNAVTLRTSTNRSYRMPSLLESNYHSLVYTPSFFISGINLRDILGPVFDYVYQPNPNLKPEYVDSLDFGILAQWPQYNSDLDIRFFYEEVRNGITSTKLNDNNGVITYTNRSEWNNKGFELQYKYQANSLLNPLLVLNYGYIQSNGHRIMDNRAGDKYWRDSLKTRNPEHTASLLASVTLPNHLQISLNHYFLSSVAWIEAARQNTDPVNKPYHRTDLKISKAFQLSPESDLSIALIVQNLLDKPYSEFYAENMFEQRTYLQAQLSF